MSKRHRLCTLFTVLGCLGWLLAPSPGYTQDTPVTIRVAPPSAEVVAGETVDLGIEVVDVVDLYGFDVTASFDPDVVEVVDADPGLAGVQVAMGLFLEPGFVLRNEADNEAGTVRLALTQLNPSPAKSGTGILFVITLRGKLAATSSPIGLLEGKLAQPTGTLLPTTLVGGQVNVVASHEGRPTYTPIPTQGPGTPMPTRTPRPTPGPGTNTPEPVPTATPTLAAGPGTPVAATATLASTPTPSEAAAEVTKAAPTPVGPSAEGSSVPPPASATPGLSATPLAMAAVGARASPGLTGRPTTAVVQVPADSGSAGLSPRSEAGSDGARALLWISLGAVGLALLLGGIAAALVLTRRRPRSGGEEDAGP